MVTPSISTYFNWLDATQQKEFRERWQKIHRMVDQWCERKPGAVIEIFAGKKTLEREIEDLESLSLAAYRAMKYLREQVKEGKARLGEFDEEEIYSG